MLKIVLVALGLVTGGFVTAKVAPVLTNKATQNETVTQVKANNEASGNITDLLLNKVSTPSDPKTEKLINKVNVDKTRVVYLSGVVNFYSIKQVVDKLKELEAASDKPIWLLIDSPGGSVLDGVTLISQIEASKAPVNTVCTRLCASMAAMIHSYGAKRYALDRAILMYHPASGGGQGQIKNMLSVTLTVQRLVDKMNLNVVNRSSIPRSDFEALVAYELWIDSEDALAKGLLDGIVNLNVSHTNDQGNQFEDRRGRSIKVDPPRTSILDFQMIGPDISKE